MPNERKVPLLHRTGLHLRAAGRFAEVANSFQSAVSMSALGRTVNGKSVLEILTLGAGPGIELLIQAEGADADKALDALEELVAHRILAVEGITHSETMMVFRVYSRHDLERMFAIGFGSEAVAA